MAKNTKKRAIIYSNVKENKKLAEERAKIKESQINLSDEVIIGFNSNKKNQSDSTKKGIERSKANKKNSKKVNKRKITQNSPSRKDYVKRNNYKSKPTKQKENKKRKNKINPQVKKKIISIIKIALILIGLIIAIVGLLKSPVFNIKEIVVKVENNSTLTESELKELSSINIGQNMFSISKKKSIESIKSNTYVENVKIKRMIPSKIQIEVVERAIEFQLENEGEYVYVDNKGIIISRSAEKKNCAVIIGAKTSEIINGNKLCDEDLNGLSDVMIILQEARSNEIYNDITRIDISNHDDYVVYFDNLGKIAHIGDTTSINGKMARIAKILKVESDYDGEIFVNVDLNNGEYPYFREKV